ncbi:MAG: hypothetical protein Q8N95_14135 [Desulfobacterales bacterium]|nr:hypothetical protein [Desulfobacterales bacterium]
MNDNGHLTEDRIIKAVADKSQLSPSEKEHLSNCSGCSSALESFENDLKQLGKIAELSVPAPKRRFIAYEKRSERNFPRVFGLRTSLAAAITVLFFVITLHSDSMKYLLNTQTGSYVDALHSDDLFITEINSLVENALPLKYMDIYGEADPDYDDDSMDFVIPSSGNETIPGEGEGGLLS